MQCHSAMSTERDAFVEAHPEAYVTSMADLGLVQTTWYAWLRSHPSPVVLANETESAPQIYDSEYLVNALRQNSRDPQTHRHMWNWKEGAIVPVIVRDAPFGMDEMALDMLRTNLSLHGITLGDWRRRFFHARPPVPSVLDSTLHPYRLVRRPSMPTQTKTKTPLPLPDVRKYHSQPTVRRPAPLWAPWAELLDLPGINTVHGFIKRVSGDS